MHARELAPFNVNCNAILPGNTETPMNENVRTDPAYAPELAAITRVDALWKDVFARPMKSRILRCFWPPRSRAGMHGSLVTIDEGISTGVG